MGLIFSDLKADLTCGSVFELSAERLWSMGISLLLADLDNTLVPYGVPLPTDELCIWKERLRAGGVSLFVLSNNRNPSRPSLFCNALGVPFIGHAGKPKTRSFWAAMERMGAKPSQTAIVGDQIFTDILGGNRAGITTILVSPIQLSGNPGRYLRYAVESPFRLASRRRHE